MTSCLDSTLLGDVSAADGIFDQVPLRIRLNPERCPNTRYKPPDRGYRKHNDECQNKDTQ